jgi:hypothetical protein
MSLDFSRYINSIDLSQSRTISVYSVSSDNIDGIEILYNNSKRMSSDNSNVSVATISPSLWMPELLNKYWDKISYVSAMPICNLLKIDGDDIVNMNYTTISKSFNSESELDDFFNSITKYNRLAFFSIMKIADLRTLSISYQVRYFDTTQKNEIRDEKIKDILN